VTSSHHQAVERVADGFRVTSRAPDGVIETIEAENGGFIAGVQWHPERCLDQPNWLLKGFVKKVEEFASGRLT
jgi:putative glutamine amidotransferase